MKETLQSSRITSDATRFVELSSSSGLPQMREPRWLE
jgi:hypothetical protein